MSEPKIVVLYGMQLSRTAPMLPALGNFPINLIGLLCRTLKFMDYQSMTSVRICNGSAHVTCGAVEKWR